MADAVDPQDILVRAVDQNIKLTRFEPQRASLHEAFVAMVGDDASHAQAVNSNIDRLEAAS